MKKKNNLLTGFMTSLLIIIGMLLILFNLKFKSNKMSDEEIINIVVDNFMEISKIPRPSHYEEKISNYLVNWAREKGFDASQDSFYNVMFNVPATKGMEDKPLGILQVHMDMVVAVADGKTFDKLNDSIKVIRNDIKGTLTADGTSLGADDGSGLAIVMAVAQGKMNHGPLRIIITSDEEDGMEGVLNINSSWLDGASYLINIDYEASNEVLVSTASGDNIQIQKNINYINATGNMAIKLEISNLKGGHSGVEIDTGRLNGVVALSNFIKGLDVDYELSSFEGGTAMNAIPNKANTLLVINSNDKSKIEEKINKYCNELKNKYKDIESDIKCTITQSSEIPMVVSKEEKDNFIKYISEINDGVYTWSSDMEGLVESSSNLGVAKLNKDGILLISMVRSSSPEKEKEICDKQLSLASLCGYQAKLIKSADAWKYDPNSKLLELTKKVYKEQNNEEIKVVAVHAGVECGTFKKIKPELDMISIGPDLKDGHTINETLYLDSIPKVWHLLEGILKDYSN